jgi:sucrose-6-phosphate hydrolase SacC (GH32 family)
VVTGKNDLYAWASVISLPRVMTLRKDGQLGIEPALELKSLRLKPVRRNQLTIPADKELNLEGMEGDSKEIAAEIQPGEAKEIGLKVRCSPDRSEETLICYLPEESLLRVDFKKATIADNESYVNNATKQEAPFQLKEGESLSLRIFIDRSVLEIYANGRQCLTQRIYPSKVDSREIRLYARGGSGKALSVEAWDMERVNPW